jgi:HEPN domain-containing protein
MPEHAIKSTGLRLPRYAEWFHRLPDILERLEKSPLPLLDRRSLEIVFRVSPRQAVRILHQFGAGQVGGAMLIRVDELQDRLRELQDHGPVEFERQRRHRLNLCLEEARQQARYRSIVIEPPRAQSPAPQSVSAAGDSLHALPEGVELRAGHLSVTFASPVELLQKLMSLARAIGEDWNQYAARAGGERDHS